MARLADAGTLPDLSGWSGLEREPRIERPLLARLQAQDHPGWPLLSVLAQVGGDPTVAALEERALRPGAATQSFANALACMDLPSAGVAFRRVASAYLERGPSAVQSVAGALLLAPDPACQALLARALAVERPPAVRMAVMNGCADCWPPSATTLLIALVTRDPDQVLRRAAYAALLRMHLEDGTAAWLRTQKDPWLRAVGVTQCGHDDLLSSLPALPDLLHATGDASAEVRGAALGQLVRLLEADVADTPPVLAEALRRLFSDMLTSDPSADVRAWTQQGLQVLGTAPSTAIAPF
jgi:HEAT repeat protein